MAHVAGPATPQQIAAYGHIAIALRDYLKRTGKDTGDLNKAIGVPRGHTSVYHWLNSKGGPGPENRVKLAKLLGCKPDDLAAKVRGRAPDAPVAGPVGQMLQQLQRPPGAHQVPRQGDVLAFTVQQDGTARIRLDATLPVATAMPLLRMIMDAGVVFAEPQT